MVRHSGIRAQRANLSTAGTAHARAFFFSFLVKARLLTGGGGKLLADLPRLFLFSNHNEKGENTFSIIVGCKSLATLTADSDAFLRVTLRTPNSPSEAGIG